MSLDFPDYVRIRRKSRLWGWLWLIGDRGYYVGVLGAVLTLAAAVISVVMILFERLAHRSLGFVARPWNLLFWCLALFVVCLVVFAVSVFLKAYARRRSGVVPLGE